MPRAGQTKKTARSHQTLFPTRRSSDLAATESYDRAKAAIWLGRANSSAGRQLDQAFCPRSPIPESVCIASANVTYLKLILKSSDNLPGTILPRFPMFVWRLWDKMAVRVPTSDQLLQSIVDEHVLGLWVCVSVEGGGEGVGVSERRVWQTPKKQLWIHTISYIKFWFQTRLKI